MTDDVEFDAVLEPLVWGRNTYTIIRVPRELEDAAAAWPTRRVEGEIEGVEVNLGLNRAEPSVLEAPFLYAGASLQRRLGLEPGEVARCRLRPADPDEVPLPDDVREALEDADALDAFELMSPGRRRRALAEIELAAKAETRARRVAALVRDLRTR
jgi:hypothetical protein